MKAIMVMFDSLNRHMLPPYGCDWVHAPNFRRLAERAVTFDRCFVGSMPCMPARREMHTGRQSPLSDPATEARLTESMVTLMRQSDAPSEQYRRMGLPE